MAPDYVCKFIVAHSFYSALVPCLLAGEICHWSRAQSMSPCLWYMFLFQLQIISSIVKQQMITGTTHLVSWLGSSTVCYRRSSRDPLCRLWSSGMNVCCPITPSFLQFLMGSFWPGHGCWQLSTRLGVRTWSGNFNVMSVDFWKSLLPPCCRLWLPAQSLDRVWAGSVRRSSSGVTVMRHFICWVFCSMVC